MISYSFLDCLWWVSTAYLVIRMLKSRDARWWLAIGLVFGLGMMTKHLFAILIAGVVIGVLLAPARRFLRSPWLWAGAALSLFLILPNLAWQIRHGFISLEFMRWIHGRGVLIGRTASFIPEQFCFSANLAAIPVSIAGLVIRLAGGRSQKFRILAWMGVLPLALRIYLQGRAYYLAPAYPMLIAAGAVVTESWLARLSPGRSRLARIFGSVVLAAGGWPSPRSRSRSHQGARAGGMSRVTCMGNFRR